MHLLIDARTIRRGRTGVGYFAESILRALDGLGGADRISAMVLQSEADGLGLHRVQLIPVRTDYEHHPAGELFLNFSVPRIARHLSADAYWGPAFMVPWLGRSVAKAVTIHDLTVFTHRSSYPAPFAAYLRAMIRGSFQASRLVIVPSETVKADVARLLGRNRPVEVVAAAADPFFHVPAGQLASEQVIGGQRVRPPFVLVPGGNDPRKNSVFAERIFERMSGKASDAQLVIAGSGRAETRGSVVRLGRIGREEMRSLYGLASVMVFPSLYEGFGLPVLEAMACGCPVLSSERGALREVGGDACRYFDPTDEEAAAVLLQEILSSPAALQELRERGLARAAQFSWQKSAAQLMHALNQMLA